ncbi:integrase [Devosia sp. UYZn731]|uniref:tyrosine-type recombinase/integrase n=1 Tax=Devosia sp. UYZn731 TaxID=3156345 RepID=UPI0033973FBB
MSVRKRPTPRKDGTFPWVVDYVDVAGKRRLKTFDKKKDADAFAARSSVEVSDGVHVADSASITIEEAGKNWIATCKANGLERTSIEPYETHLKLHIVPLIGKALVSRMSVPSIRDFEDKLRAKGLSQAMIRRVVGSVGALIGDAQERGQAMHNPVREMRGRRKGKERRLEQRHKGKLKVGVDIPTRDEAKAFLGALQGRWRPLLMTALFCGLRSSELRGLAWADIDLERRELHVRQRADRFNDIGSPKSAAGDRTVPIPAMLANTLKEWKLACPKSELGLAFPNGTGKPEAHANIINRGLVPAMIAAGVTVEGMKRGKPAVVARYSGLHSLRHWFASWCINPVSRGGMGLSPQEVQDRVGHSSISTTLDVYGHLFPVDDTTAAVDAAERSLLS